MAAAAAALTASSSGNRAGDTVLRLESRRSPGWEDREGTKLVRTAAPQSIHNQCAFLRGKVQQAKNYTSPAPVQPEDPLGAGQSTKQTHSIWEAEIRGGHLPATWAVSGWRARRRISVFILPSMEGQPGQQWGRLSLPGPSH